MPGTDLEPGVLLNGELPDDLDLEVAMATVPRNGFSVFGTPGSSQLAVLSRHSSERSGLDDDGCFEQVGSATCVDCVGGVDPCAASFDRTIRLQLAPLDSDADELVYTAVESTASNFMAPTPALIFGDAGVARDVEITGTLGSCSTFSYSFAARAEPVECSTYDNDAAYCNTVPDCTFRGGECVGEEPVDVSECSEFRLPQTCIVNACFWTGIECVEPPE